MPTTLLECDVDAQLAKESSELGAGALRPDLGFDQYRSLLEPHDLTDQQAHELLAALWSIMRTFVELGWGVESVQRVLPILGEHRTDEELSLPNDP